MSERNPDSGQFTATRVPSTADAIGCLEEAQRELARNDPKANWWADVHLRDAQNEIAALRRLVAKLPRQV